MIMDPDIPIPPVGYGGIERIVYLLACEYHKAGHQVTVFAGPGSKVPCSLVMFGTSGSVKSKIIRTAEIFQAWGYYLLHHHEYDVMQSFGRLSYFLPIFMAPVKKVMCYQRHITAKNIRIADLLPHRNLAFAALSDSCKSTGNVRGRWKTIYNGVPIEKFTFQSSVTKDAPLIFLGRLDQIKGAHTAIRVAKATGDRLILAGNKPHLSHEIEYYQREVEPLIDQKQIIYVGEVNDEQKNHYLGQAKALLFPIEWDEPFGIVMAESLACGTPVIAFRRGSVPEVIDHGKTGYICDHEDEMVFAVRQINAIRRKDCREVSERRFSGNVIARNYLEYFAQI